MQIKYDILKYEIEEREELLYRYNEKIASAKLIVLQLKKSSQEVRNEFLNKALTNATVSIITEGRGGRYSSNSHSSLNSPSSSMYSKSPSLLSGYGYISKETEKQLHIIEYSEGDICE